MDAAVFFYTIMIFMMVCFVPIIVISWMCRKIAKSASKLTQQIKRL